MVQSEFNKNFLYAKKIKITTFFQQFGFSLSILINIYAFSRRFYPKRLTVHSGYTFFVSKCVPWELNPQSFALLMQCSTAEPQEHFTGTPRVNVTPFCTLPIERKQRTLFCIRLNARMCYFTDLDSGIYLEVKKKRKVMGTWYFFFHVSNRHEQVLWKT